MQVRLAYGKGGLVVDFPDDRTTVIEPLYVEGLSAPAGAVKDALEAPMDSVPLAALAGRNTKVAIAVCDVTRPMPNRIVLPEILGQLKGVPSRNITILVATGTHRPSAPAELKQMLGEGVLEELRVVNHDATNSSDLEWFGKTPTGTPVWLNRYWLDADLRITTGFVEPHFFAGFSGGPKLVAPGLAGLETIMCLHSAPLIGNPRSTWGIVDENPLHRAIREVAEETGVDFAVDVTLNRDKQITGVFAGDLFKEHREACSTVRETAMKPVSGTFDLVVTTNSGYPLDLNLYQSVKGMSAAARVVRHGGAIICGAECSDGIPGNGEYEAILKSASNPERLLDMIAAPGYCRQDQWQVQVQAMVQLKAKVYLKSGSLAPEDVRAAHLEPIDDVEQTVKDELAARGPEARVCVLPEGPQTIPYLAPAGSAA